ncbi:DUF4214 domain-containing protein [Salipiger abyssi]|uniref:DUF4214 domain-containing protein n=1 Tax=Salipiger abyssi TaxID=1250539 RepID=UPI001A8D61C3|nr:DUF4214 domain-containing protein [Salipiger abyssi]MBN9889850.1 DUF4214 domain-containing protein [Salipiger abyssi]
MLLTYYGNENDFLDDAFYNSDTDGFEPDLISSTSTRIVISNPTTGYRTTLIGSGLSADPQIAGTLSRIEIRDDSGRLTATMTDIDWPLNEFVSAMDELMFFGEDAALMALLDRAPITVDATPSTMRNFFFLDNVTAPVTYLGADTADGIISGDGNDLLRGGNGNDSLLGMWGEDSLYGGPGDDYLMPGDSDVGVDYVDPGTGDDEVDTDLMEDGFLQVAHEDMVGSGNRLIFEIDGHGNSARITKTGGNGVTEIIDPVTAMEADGLGLNGTASNDRFDLTVSDDGWMSATGGRGDDSFNIGASEGTVRLDYREDNSGTSAARGIRVNLETGIVSEDGFGGTDTIVRATTLDGQTGESYVPGRLEIRGTAHTDILTGSADMERFIPLSGNDTVDGGAGWDMLRYDQHGASTAVTVDLADGTATGAWREESFSQTVSNIESVRGTREFGDRLSGSLSAESLDGRGGDDLLLGDGFDPSYAPEEAATVFRLYQATLDRAPNASGLANWTERLYTGERSLLQVTDGFVKSPEFRATYGALDNEGFVTLLYRNVLDRDPDAQGLGNWTARLDDGMSRAQVVRGFAQSGEFTDSTAADARAFGEASSQAGWSDDVYRLYRATLDRDPDLRGFTNWTGRLAEGADPESVTDSFVRSPEFQATYGALDNEGFVTLLYRNVLDRDPDAQGLGNWTARLDDGMSRAQVVRGFAQSGEFVAGTADDLKDWMRGLDHGAGDGYHDWLIGGTGDNTLAGGLFADVFEFAQDEGGSHRVLDLEAWDYLMLDGFGYDSAADARAHMTRSGTDVVFADQGVEITFADTRLNEIADDMLLV